MAAKRGARNGILSLAIKDKAVLYAAYMPFVHNGGLFIPTKKDYHLGDDVPDEGEPVLLVFLGRKPEGLHRDTLPVTPFSIDVSDSAPLSSGAFFSIQCEFSKIVPEPSPPFAKAQSRL